MKKDFSLVGRIASIIGLTLGAFALAALASTWTAPSTIPPDGNVAAPINVGGRDGTDQAKWYSQIKTGLLVLNNLVVVNMNVASGTPAGLTTPGSVLANDGLGNARWMTLAELGVSTSGTVNNFYNTSVPFITVNNRLVCRGACTVTSAPVSWTVPAGVTKVRVHVFGGGGGGAYYPGFGGSAGKYNTEDYVVTGGQILKITVGGAGGGGGSMGYSCTNNMYTPFDSQDYGYRVGKIGYGSGVLFPDGHNFSVAGGGGGPANCTGTFSDSGDDGTTAAGYSFGSGGNAGMSASKYGSSGTAGGVVIQY